MKDWEYCRRRGLWVSTVATFRGRGLVPRKKAGTGSRVHIPVYLRMMLKVRRLSGYTWAAKRLRWQARGLRCILRAWFSWPSLHYAICNWFHAFSLRLHRADKHHAFVSIDMCRVHRQRSRKARYESCSALIAEIRTGCRAERNASRTESINDDYHSTTTTDVDY